MGAPRCDSDRILNFPMHRLANWPLCGDIVALVQFKGPALMLRVRSQNKSRTVEVLKISRIGPILTLAVFEKLASLRTLSDVSLEAYRKTLTVFGLTSLVFAALVMGKPQRIGDGSEYYAMFLTWLHSHRPWITDVAQSAYAELLSSEKVRFLVGPVIFDGSAYPIMRLEHGYDYYHFWFYSLLAFLVHEIASLVSASGIQIHTSFVILHWVLFEVMMLTAWRTFKWRGVITAGLLMLSSPIIWFSDKVHTEFFTFSLGVSAMFLLARGRLELSALLFAVMGTQNISFSAISVFVALVALVERRSRSRAEVFGSYATGVLLVLHPAYYFFRYGKLTPQLGSGAAEFGENLNFAFIWLVDPDVGLLPNWLIGSLLLGAAALLGLRKPQLTLLKGTGTKGLIWVFYLGITLVAHASTLNINSGGTTGVSRYGLWYIPLFVPIVLWLLKLGTIRARRLIIGVIVILSIPNIYQNHPGVREQYTSPSFTSMIIQTYIPRLYDPPAEIFGERYSGVGEAFSMHGSFPVMGPDCSKLLVPNGRVSDTPSIPAACANISVTEVERFISTLIADNTPRQEYVYFEPQAGE